MGVKNIFFQSLCSKAAQRLLNAQKREEKRDGKSHLISSVAKAKLSKNIDSEIIYHRHDMKIKKEKNSRQSKKNQVLFGLMKSVMSKIL